MDLSRMEARSSCSQKRPQAAYYPITFCCCDQVATNRFVVSNNAAGMTFLSPTISVTVEEGESFLKLGNFFFAVSFDSGRHCRCWCSYKVVELKV